jgi:ketosteroid isomerase-like protein
MQERFLQTMVLALSTIFLLGSVAVGANAQSTKALPNDVIAANQELDRQLLEAHRLLDAQKIMGLFTSSPDIFFIGPAGNLSKGRDQVRQTWEQFFASLESIHGEINHITYLPAGDGVIAVGQVTYHRQFKGATPDQAIVVWTDFRHKENGKWVYVFRHAHWPLALNPLPNAMPSTNSPTAERP